MSKFTERMREAWHNFHTTEIQWLSDITCEHNEKLTGEGFYDMLQEMDEWIANNYTQNKNNKEKE